MREDFEKVLQRPRTGSSSSNYDAHRARRYKDIKDEDKLEALPKRMPMKPKGWDYDDRKGFEYNFNLLRRFLRSKVGKPWDKTYSKICKAVKSSARHSRETLQYVESFVDRQAEIQPDGEVLESHVGWRGARYTMWDDGSSFYVDSHGILQVPKRKTRKSNGHWRPSGYRQPNPTYFPYGLGGEKWERSGGIWYRHTTELRRNWNTGYHGHAQCEQMPVKKQLSKKELKRIPQKIRDA